MSGGAILLRRAALTLAVVAFPSAGLDLASRGQITEQESTEVEDDRRGWIRRRRDRRRRSRRRRAPRFNWDQIKNDVGNKVNEKVNNVGGALGSALREVNDVVGGIKDAARAIQPLAKLRAARRELPQVNVQAMKDRIETAIQSRISAIASGIENAVRESVEFAQAVKAAAEGLHSDLTGNPTTVLIMELLGMGSNFTCADPDTTYDATKFQIGGIFKRGTWWEFNSPAGDLGFEMFEYDGFDAQLKCRDGSDPTFSATIETDKGPKPWEEACEMGVNQCGGAYDTDCYGEKTEKSAKINEFLRKVFIPKFNPCCESHDRGYCYPAGGDPIVSEWTSEEYPYAAGWHPYSNTSTPYIYPNMLGGGQFPPYNPSGGKLAVDDRFQACMHQMCSDDEVFGDNADAPVEELYDAIMGALGFVPDFLKQWARDTIISRLTMKKNLARGWCDLRAQIAAAAVRAGGLKAYTAKQAKMLTCPPPPDCSASPGCVEGSGDQVNNVNG